jgi:hypothetical protein
MTGMDFGVLGPLQVIHNGTTVNLGPAGVDQMGQARYSFHDLTRDYARERAEREEPLPARLAALRLFTEVDAPGAQATAERLRQLPSPSGG